MNDIVNLRQARKRRARAENEARAAANRVEFGRTKAERKQTEAQRRLDVRKLEAKRIASGQLDGPEDSD